MKDVNDTQSYPLDIVPTPHIDTPIASHSEMTNKRTFSDAMETEHEDNTTTSKKKKIHVEGEVVKVKKTKGNKKQMKVKVPAFEIKEYSFSKNHEEYTTQFKTKVELFDKYRDDKEVSTNESLKLYVDVRKISSKDVALVTVRDHAQNTLNLAVTSKNKVAEMMINMENIPVPDMILLHK